MTNAVSVAQYGSSNPTMRNRIINGAMVIDQRNSGAATANTISGYTIDRWAIYQSTTGKLIAQQNQNSVTPPAGFTKYLGVTSQSAYSVASSDAYQLYQFIEGYNIADLGWGTANAKTVTLSFQVYSSLTGNFGGSIYSSSASTQRSYPFTYSVPVANTWTQISITVPGDTFTNTFNTTNGQGLNVNFGLGSGSTYTTSTTGWQTGVFIQPTGTISVVGTNGATFYITGVQFEVGTTATPFEYRQYGTELALCQRYFYLSNPTNVLKNGGAWGTMYTTTNAHITGPLPVPMRTAPTFTFVGTSNTFYISTITSTSTGTPVNTSSSNLIIDFEITSLSSGGIGYPVQYNGQLYVNAEL